jgi:hypothetical protein
MATSTAPPAPALPAFVVLTDRAGHSSIVPLAVALAQVTTAPRPELPHLVCGKQYLMLHLAPSVHTRRGSVLPAAAPPPSRVNSKALRWR